MSSSARIEELRKKFDENPRRYFAPLANEYRKAGDFDQAIFICQEYLPQQPGHMSGHIVFGQALFEAKRLPDAKVVFETALSLDPENLIALRHLADISRDLGDTAAARTWYERVLHADPRNEEIAAIMVTLGTGSTAAAAEAPVAPAPPPAPAVSAAPPRKIPDPSSSAATVVLSAAQVQEMIKARQAPKGPPPLPEPAPEVELLTLDSASTVEIRVLDDAPASLVGLEPTSQAASAPLEGLEPTSQTAPMEMPAFETLGLETNMAPGQRADAATTAAPLDGLDSISLDLTMPGETPVAPAAPLVAPTMEIPAINISEPAAAGDDGLLDLGSFSFGGETVAPTAATPTPATAAPSIDGGPEDSDLLDFDLPATPEPTPARERTGDPAPEAEITVPTMIMEAVNTVAPTMMDFVEAAVPSVIEGVATVVPAVVGAVTEIPTVIMAAIKVQPPPMPMAKEPPPVVESERPPRTSQAVPFVTETMAQLYLSQGHRAEAMDIYRKLIDARPGDEELKAKLAAIEAEDRRPAAAPVERAPAPAEKRFTGSGPSIRTVLRELFGLDGAQPPSNVSSSGTPSEVGSIDLLFASESVGDPPTPLAVAFDGGYVATQGNIDELFGGGAQ